MTYPPLSWLVTPILNTANNYVMTIWFIIYNTKESLYNYKVIDCERSNCVHSCSFIFQILILTKFLRKFIDDNPLLPCRDEITQAKKDIFQVNIKIVTTGEFG